MDVLLDWGMSPERTSHDWKLGIFSPATHPPERAAGLETEVIIDNVYMRKPS